MTNKIYEAIRNLPDDPDGPIYWVCYNEDMELSAIQLIKLIKGEEYLAKCRVVSKNKFDVPSEPRCIIYYSPDLLDHVGNGAN